MFDIFYNQEGSQSIFNMTHLTAREFQCLWDLVAAHVMSHWNIGRGKRCTFGEKGVLFMMLATLKHGRNWDWTGKIFGVKGLTFERMIVNCVNIVSEYLYNYLVETEARRFSLSDIEEKGKGFYHYPFAKYATDVTFQQSNRSLGNHQESKVYFSGKYKLYGYKCEVSVLPIGIACHATGYFPCSVADIDIFYKHHEQHLTLTRKTKTEEEYEDNDLHADKYPNHWAILFDKGYQGSLEMVRAVYPSRKPPMRSLSLEQKAKNKRISHDRIIVENFFGRVCTFWNVLASKYRWKESLYDAIFKLSIALTNFHVKFHPLRAEDGEYYRKYKARMSHIGTEKQLKRRRCQKQYREKRRRRLDSGFRGSSTTPQYPERQPLYTDEL